MEKRLVKTLPDGLFHETEEKRSKIMASIKATDTKPELGVRRLVHGMGYRYRVHVRELPGKPDLVFPSRRRVIFVNGCFWHKHSCRLGTRNPKAHSEYWIEKLEGNVRRDKRNRRLLQKEGWGVMVIWECQVVSKNLEHLGRRIMEFLDS